MKSTATAMLSVFFLAGFLCPDAQARTSEAAAALYNKGNQYYADGNYLKAAQTYDSVIATGVCNADLYYNAGNAWLKADKTGQAIYYYLLGLKISPRDPDLRHNLAFARVKIKGKLPEVEKTALARAANKTLQAISLNEITIVISSIYLLLVTALIFRLTFSRASIRSVSSRVAVLAATGLVLCAPFFVVKLNREILRETAVVMEQKISARSGPGEDNARLFDLYEGMELTVKQKEAGWSRIELANGLSGWVPENSFAYLVFQPHALKAAP